MSRQSHKHRLVAGARVRDLRDNRGTVIAARYGSAKVEVLWDTGTVKEEHHADLEKVGRGRPRIRK